ncbi:MAG: hypothetical protein ACRED8_09470 [Caulobacteraceae bacterium]
MRRDIDRPHAERVQYRHAALCQTLLVHHHWRTHCRGGTGD